MAHCIPGRPGPSSVHINWSVSEHWAHSGATALRPDAPQHAQRQFYAVAPAFAPASDGWQQPPGPGSGGSHPPDTRSRSSVVVGVLVGRVVARCARCCRGCDIHSGRRRLWHIHDLRLRRLTDDLGPGLDDSGRGTGREDCLLEAGRRSGQARGVQPHPQTGTHQRHDDPADKCAHALSVS